MKHKIELSDAEPVIMTKDVEAGTFVRCNINRLDRVLLRTYHGWVDISDPLLTWPADMTSPCRPLRAGTVITLTVGEGNA